MNEQREYGTSPGEGPEDYISRNYQPVQVSGFISFVFPSLWMFLFDCFATFEAILWEPEKKLKEKKKKVPKKDVSRYLLQWTRKLLQWKMKREIQNLK